MKSVALFLLTALCVKWAWANPMDPRQPQPWFDVRWTGYYYLTADLEPAPGVVFKTGQKFEFVGITGGGGYVPVTVFELKPLVCETPQLETELVLLNPAGGNKTEIGFEMRKNCVMAFFVENRLVSTSSYFTDSTE
ncbi:hypothetical protein Bb109J_c0969 [Bdellovibrio bacteriovorus]|uniref:hypothetical protein n=1 Tax=Bdellovibrio bacteriovorus TaxID=959 RepID=UPI00045BEEBD|nr:hypothetical protein [Bdellovibrio bacteriovorus]AHZ86311.1 hypothetical protein EP01_15410 [Bdellovibrio bacteriovorus]BEV67549.1 hypothetical protein Bb109J_c0969 [Bdellovibrio bacteriovorus]